MARARPVIDVRSERETARGWSYDVAVTDADGAVTTHEITLSWVDHDHWSGGSAPPSRVVEAVLSAVLAAEADAPPLRPGDLPARFDLATLRRWAPDLDEHLRL